MKFNKNHILIVLLLTLFILGVFFGYQLWQASKEENINKTFEKYEPQEESFSKIVTGYVVLEEKDLPSKEDFEKYYWDVPPENPFVKETYVYFNVTDYTDKEFIGSLEEMINQGNTVNSKSNGQILFNFGCLENDKIITDSNNTDYYIDKETKETILESTKENPIRVIIDFNNDNNSGCRCCSFAKKVRLY